MPELFYIAIPLALVACALLTLLVLHRRRRAAIEEVTRQLHRIAVGGALRGRVELSSNQTDLAALVTVTNHLLTRVAGTPATAKAESAGPAPLSALADQLHDAVLIHTRHRIVYANPQFAQLIGAQPADLTGRRLEELVAPEYAELVGDHIRRLLANEPAAARYEVDLLGLQGQLARLELSAWPIVHEGQKALLIVGVEVLPTQTVQALAAPGGMRSRARAALMSMPGAVATLDARGRVEFLNPAAMALLGYTGDTANGMSPAQLLNSATEADQNALAELVQQTLHAGTPGDLGHRPLQVGPEALKRSVEVTAAPIRNDAGEVEGAVLTFGEPATPPAPAQAREESAAAPAAHTLAHAALMSLPGAVAAFNAQGLAEYLNPAARALLGIAGDAAAGQTPAQLLSAASAAGQRAIAEQIHQILAGATSAALAPQSLSVGEGAQARELAVTAAPIRDESGQVQGAVLTFNERSSRPESEARESPPMRSHDRAAFAALPGAVALLDSLGQIEYLNPAASALLGYSNEAASEKTPEQLLDTASEAVQERLAVLVEQTLTGDAPLDPRQQRLSIGAGNDRRMVDVTAAPIRNLDGAVDGAVLTFSDVTHAISASGLRARAALTSMPDAVATLDAQGQVEYLNPAAMALLGYTGDAAHGMSAEQLLATASEADRKLLAELAQQALTAAAPLNLGRRPLGLGQGANERQVEVTAAPMYNPAGVVEGAVLTFNDVTESRGLTRQISYQAAHDALTGLVNRREFERRLQEAIDSAKRGESSHVLCYLDLDRFKVINDTSGHQAGDSLLRDIAKLARGTVRDSDTVGRLGGDEFGMLLVGCPLDRARQIADDVCRRIAEHRFVWRDRIFSVGASIGLVEISTAAGHLEDVLAAADSACYQAKRLGGHVTVYSARDESYARETGEIHWLQLLQSALKEHRFELYCQPIVAAYGDGATGPAMEVLVRLRNDDGKQISPKDFLQAAERYRLMGLVDRQIVRTTLDALGRGAIPLPRHRCIGINISGQTLADEQFLEFVVECFDATGATPAQVCFEIAESAVIANLEHARRFIGVLHGMGCRFALDDFGSGVGSFAKLKLLAVDFLKIDGQFMRNLARDSVNQAMVTAMIKMARTMNFKVIAEHVEDDSSAEAAREIGVDYLQGYAMGRPEPLPLAA